MAEQIQGKITQIIGAVLDIKFPEGKLPKIYDAIHIAAPDGGVLTAEVAQHLGDDTVRCIAMGPTDGLVRGAEAIATGAPITVPVGEPGIPESFKVLIKELQSLGLDVKVLKEDQTEVELMETVDYGDTDLRSVIEGDNKDYNRKEESSFGEYGYTKQEFEGDELVDVQEESAPDEAIFSPDEVFEEE